MRRRMKNPLIIITITTTTDVTIRTARKIIQTIRTTRTAANVFETNAENAAATSIGTAHCGRTELEMGTVDETPDGTKRVTEQMT